MFFPGPCTLNGSVYLFFSFLTSLIASFHLLLLNKIHLKTEVSMSFNGMMFGALISSFSIVAQSTHFNS